MKKGRKQERREEAEVRQEEYDKLSTKDKLALAESQIGESAKVISKLRKELKKKDE